MKIVFCCADSMIFGFGHAICSRDTAVPFKGGNKRYDRLVDLLGDDATQLISTENHGHVWPFEWNSLAGRNPVGQKNPLRLSGLHYMYDCNFLGAVQRFIDCSLIVLVGLPTFGTRSDVAAWLLGSS